MVTAMGPGQLGVLHTRRWGSTAPIWRPTNAAELLTLREQLEGGEANGRGLCSGWGAFSLLAGKGHTCSYALLSPGQSVSQVIQAGKQWTKEATKLYGRGGEAQLWRG